MRTSLSSVALVLLVLTGCSQAQPSSKPAESQSFVRTDALEQLPSQLSIPHVRTMVFSGTTLMLERIMEKNDVYTKYAISYRSNGLKITGVFLLPHGDGPYPLLVFNHGFIDPAVYTQGRGLKREEDYMARQGFAVVHPDYRGHAGSDPSPMVDNVYDGNLEYAMDSANVILAFREARLPTVDAQTVGMLGHSLGGGVTLALLTAKPDLVTAAVLYAPVHANVWENFTRWRAKREQGDRTIAAFGTPDTHPQFWSNLSPLTFLDDIVAPILIFHGSKDKDVPEAWSDFLARELSNRGKKVTFVKYEGEAHEFSFQWQDFMAKTTDFFRSQFPAQEFISP